MIKVGGSGLMVEPRGRNVVLRQVNKNASSFSITVEAADLSDLIAALQKLGAQSYEATAAPK